MKSKWDVLALGAGIVGGVLGSLAFEWCARQGLYSLVLPGGVLGLAAGLFRNNSRIVSLLCGLMAFGFGCVTQWRFSPFAADDSLRYFLFHLHQLRPVTLIMIGAGTLIGFWVPFRRYRSATD